MARILTALLLATVAPAGEATQAVQAHLSTVGHRAEAENKKKGSGFVRGIEFNHRLRICNAYPYAAALDVYRGKSDSLTEGEPMPYKDCRDFLTPLKSGDKLEFKVGDAQAGTFSISDLPNNDAILLLVIHRHDTLSTAVAFESHVFANLLNAQVAIIDTYKGSAKAQTRIIDSGKGGNRSEELRFNSVVAVNPGLYEVDLADVDGKTKAKSELVALNRQSYIILRTGVESESGPSYPQELVIFPHSPVDKLPHSGAQARATGSFALAMLAATVVALFSATSA